MAAIASPQLKLVPRHALVSDRRLVWVLTCIDAHLVDPALTVTHLAQQVRLSPSQLRRLAQAQLGFPLKQRISELRLIRAQELFLTTFLSVKEATAAVGFNDPSHFSRNYRRLFGVGPSEQRRAASLAS